MEFSLRMRGDPQHRGRLQALGQQEVCTGMHARKSEKPSRKIRYCSNLGGAKSNGYFCFGGEKEPPGHHLTQSDLLRANDTQLDLVIYGSQDAASTFRQSCGKRARRKLIQNNAGFSAHPIRKGATGRGRLRPNPGQKTGALGKKGGEDFEIKKERKLSILYTAPIGIRDGNKQLESKLTMGAGQRFGFTR